MPMLIDGQWTADDSRLWSADGTFQRATSQFRNWIVAEGADDTAAHHRYVAECGRYHLYVAAACPWAHRTLLVRRLKGLEHVVSSSSVDALMLDDGWTFGHESAETRDTLNQTQYLYELYLLSNPSVTSRVTVPVLWDRATQTIVSNESSEIIRMFNCAFAGVGANDIELFPKSLRDEIERVNSRVYADVNCGVYKTGFARTESARQDARDSLFSALDWLEDRLDGRQWLVGDQMTEADIRLFPTLIRFDSVYYEHFRCDRNRLAEMPNLHAYTKHIYRLPGVAETVDMESTRLHYYGSHRSLNPSGVVPPSPAFLY